MTEATEQARVSRRLGLVAAGLGWWLPRIWVIIGRTYVPLEVPRVTLSLEEKRVRSLFERVETVEDVAGTLAENDERRARLLAVSNSALAEEATIRPVIAARLLGLSEKTIRAWAADGVLIVVQRKPRLLLDVHSVHVISHILRDLRAADRDRDLLEEVWRRLNDSALLDRNDLRESLQQMRRGDGRVLRPHAGGVGRSR
jgi:hypothetical protein